MATKLSVGTLSPATEAGYRDAITATVPASDANTVKQPLLDPPNGGDETKHAKLDRDGLPVSGSITPGENGMSSSTQSTYDSDPPQRYTSNLTRPFVDNTGEPSSTSGHGDRLGAPTRAIGTPTQPSSTKQGSGMARQGSGSARSGAALPPQVPGTPSQTSPHISTAGFHGYALVPSPSSRQMLSTLDSSGHYVPLPVSPPPKRDVTPAIRHAPRAASFPVGGFSRGASSNDNHNTLDKNKAHPTGAATPNSRPSTFPVLTTLPSPSPPTSRSAAPSGASRDEKRNEAASRHQRNGTFDTDTIDLDNPVGGRSLLKVGPSTTNNTPITTTTTTTTATTATANAKADTTKTSSHGRPSQPQRRLSTSEVLPAHMGDSNTTQATASSPSVSSSGGYSLNASPVPAQASAPSAPAIRNGRLSNVASTTQGAGALEKGRSSPRASQPSALPASMPKTAARVNAPVSSPQASPRLGSGVLDSFVMEFESFQGPPLRPGSRATIGSPRGKGGVSALPSTYSFASGVSYGLGSPVDVVSHPISRHADHNEKNVGQTRGGNPSGSGGDAAAASPLPPASEKNRFAFTPSLSRAIQANRPTVPVDASTKSPRPFSRGAPAAPLTAVAYDSFFAELSLPPEERMLPVAGAGSTKVLSLLPFTYPSHPAQGLGSGAVDNANAFNDMEWGFAMDAPEKLDSQEQSLLDSVFTDSNSSFVPLATVKLRPGERRQQPPPPASGDPWLAFGSFGGGSAMAATVRRSTHPAAQPPNHSVGRPVSRAASFAGDNLGGMEDDLDEWDMDMRPVLDSRALLRAPSVANSGTTPSEFNLANRHAASSSIFGGYHSQQLSSHHHIGSEDSYNLSPFPSPSLAPEPNSATAAGPKGRMATAWSPSPPPGARDAEGSVYTFGLASAGSGRSSPVKGGAASTAAAPATTDAAKGAPNRRPPSTARQPNPAGADPYDSGLLFESGSLYGGDDREAARSTTARPHANTGDPLADTYDLGLSPQASLGSHAFHSPSSGALLKGRTSEVGRSADGRAGDVHSHVYDSDSSSTRLLRGGAAPAKGTVGSSSLLKSKQTTAATAADPATSLSLSKTPARTAGNPRSTSRNTRNTAFDSLLALPTSAQDGKKDKTGDDEPGSPSDAGSNASRAPPPSSSAKDEEKAKRESPHPNGDARPSLLPRFLNRSSPPTQSKSADTATDKGTEHSVSQGKTAAPVDEDADEGGFSFGDSLLGPAVGSSRRRHRTTVPAGARGSGRLGTGPIRDAHAADTSVSLSRRDPANSVQGSRRSLRTRQSNTGHLQQPSTRGGISPGGPQTPHLDAGSQRTAVPQPPSTAPAPKMGSPAVTPSNPRERTSNDGNMNDTAKNKGNDKAPQALLTLANPMNRFGNNPTYDTTSPRPNPWRMNPAAASTRATTAFVESAENPFYGNRSLTAASSGMPSESYSTYSPQEAAQPLHVAVTPTSAMNAPGVRPTPEDTDDEDLFQNVESDDDDNNYENRGNSGGPGRGAGDADNLNRTQDHLFSQLSKHEADDNEAHLEAASATIVAAAARAMRDVDSDDDNDPALATITPAMTSHRMPPTSPDSLSLSSSSSDDVNDAEDSGSNNSEAESDREERTRLAFLSHYARERAVAEGDDASDDDAGSLGGDYDGDGLQSHDSNGSSDFLGHTFAPSAVTMHSEGSIDRARYAASPPYGASRRQHMRPPPLQRPHRNRPLLSPPRGATMSGSNHSNMRSPAAAGGRSSNSHPHLTRTQPMPLRDRTAVLHQLLQNEKDARQNVATVIRQQQQQQQQQQWQQMMRAGMNRPAATAAPASPLNEADEENQRSEWARELLTTDEGDSPGVADLLHASGATDLEDDSDTLSPHMAKRRWYAYIVHEIHWVDSPNLSPDLRPLNDPTR